MPLGRWCRPVVDSYVLTTTERTAGSAKRVAFAVRTRPRIIRKGSVSGRYHSRASKRRHLSGATGVGSEATQRKTEGNRPTNFVTFHSIVHPDHSRPRTICLSLEAHVRREKTLRIPSEEPPPSVSFEEERSNAQREKNHPHLLCWMRARPSSLAGP